MMAAAVMWSSVIYVMGCCGNISIDDAPIIGVVTSIIIIDCQYSI
jgi:hypothetical protein